MRDFIIIYPTMISNSVTSERRRSASSSQKLVNATGRRSLISRQVAPIYKEEGGDDDENDVEAPQPSLEQQRVLRPSVRRRSSLNRTRQTIVRLLKDNEQTREARRSTNLLSPLDLLVNPDDNNVMHEDELHQIWEQKQEDQKKSTRPWYIILPSSKFRLTWDFFMSWLLSMMAFYIPYRVCLYWEEDVEARSIFIFESTLDAIFALDIVFNFLTAYTDNATDLVVTAPKKIATRYLKGFFLIDLIATIPFGTILQASPLAIGSKMGKLGRLPKMIRFAKAARLLKLLRVYKLHEFMTKIEVQYNVHHGISRMIKIIMLIMLVTHLVGCFWFLIGLTGGQGEGSSIDFDDDRLDGGWVYRYKYEGKSKREQYTASMYWAFSTLTTVGYGDISARSPQEQIYAMGMMLIGVSWYAYIVSSMSSIMNSFDAQNKAIRDKMMTVNEFCRTAKLPKELSRQVRDFFEFKMAKSQHAFLISSNYDVDELLDELGSGLRADVLLYMDRQLISKVPFLQNKVPQFVADIISMFQPMVFQENDYICKEGTQADEMFFLIKGKAGIYYGSKLIVMLDEGSYFGEIGCIMGGIRRAGVKALSLCELQTLSRRNLNILLGEYPDVGEELKRVARERASVARKGKSPEKEQVILKSESSTSVANTTSEVDEKEDIGPHRGSDQVVALPPHLKLDEQMIDTMVKLFADKLRKDLAASSSSRIPSQTESGAIT